jgi:hypothetical protein
MHLYPSSCFFFLKGKAFLQQDLTRLGGGGGLGKTRTADTSEALHPKEIPWYEFALEAELYRLKILNNCTGNLTRDLPSRGAVLQLTATPLAVFFVTFKYFQRFILKQAQFTHVTVFWVLPPRISGGRYRNFGEKCHLHPSGTKNWVKFKA